LHDELPFYPAKSGKGRAILLRAARRRCLLALADRPGAAASSETLGSGPPGGMWGARSLIQTAGDLLFLPWRIGLAAPGGKSLWRAFFKSAARITDGPWSVATGADFLHPRVEGQRPRCAALRNRNLRRVLKAKGRDPLVSTCFFENNPSPSETLGSLPAGSYRPRVAREPVSGTAPIFGRRVSAIRIVFRA